MLSSLLNLTLSTKTANKSSRLRVVQVKSRLKFDQYRDRPDQIELELKLEFKNIKTAYELDYIYILIFLIVKLHLYF